MNTQHLQYIIEIERTRSISQAAENLFIGQPNLSRILHDVEQMLGFRIFERSTRGVRPTTRGTIFLQHAKSILRETEAIEALGPKRAVANRLRVCIPRSAAMLDLTAQYLAGLPQAEPVDAVICALDSLNYLSRPDDCRKTFRRVYDALKPGGLFVFDINTPAKLRGLDGQVFLDENEDSYCVWRAEFDQEENRCYYGIDLFRRRGTLWERSFEQHCEYAYDPAELTAWLEAAGFAQVRQFADCRMEPPRADEQRIYFCAIKPETEETT